MNLQFSSFEKLVMKYIKIDVKHLVNLLLYIFLIQAPILMASFVLLFVKALTCTCTEIKSLAEQPLAIYLL